MAASTGVMAQATISGSLDVAAINNGKVTTSANAANPANITRKTSSTGLINSWTTNQISISGSEDLGGGLRASFVINSGIAQNTIGNRDTFLALSGGFGTVRMGRFAPAGSNGFHGYTGAATTAFGSIYGINGASAGLMARVLGNTIDDAVLAAGGNAGAAGNFERNNNNIQYTSPNFNGLTVNVNYGSNKSDVSNKTGEASARQSGLSVTYVAGPLSVGIGTQDRKVKGTFTAATGLPATETANPIKGDLDWVGASYNFGAATVFATHVKRKDVTTTAGVAATNADAKINAIGVSVPMGAITFNASTYTGKDKRGSAAADDVKLSGHQLSVRYALSKRTTIYALVGENKIARDAAAGTSAARKETGNMVGVMHSF